MPLEDFEENVSDSSEYSSELPQRLTWKIERPKTIEEIQTRLITELSKILKAKFTPQRRNDTQREVIILKCL